MNARISFTFWMVYSMHIIGRLFAEVREMFAHILECFKTIDLKQRKIDLMAAILQVKDVWELLGDELPSFACVPCVVRDDSCYIL